MIKLDILVAPLLTVSIFEYALTVCPFADLSSVVSYPGLPDPERPRVLVSVVRRANQLLRIIIRSSNEHGSGPLGSPAQ
jgi:hypothetical protein